jgi:hypothetical protein
MVWNPLGTQGGLEAMFGRRMLRSPAPATRGETKPRHAGITTTPSAVSGLYISPQPEIYAWPHVAIR